MTTENDMPTVLLYCGHTVRQEVRSGIQRVVVEAARALIGRCNLRLVKWDVLDGQLRDLDLRDLRALFRSDDPPIGPHPACHRVRYRFVDTVENPETAWLLNPEIFYFADRGTLQFAAMRAQCAEAGIRSAAVFYDLIPAVEPAYAAGRPPHLEYMVELALCDRIFPISHFSAASLMEFLADETELSVKQLDAIRARVIPAPLGEYREGEAWGQTLTVSSSAPLPHMVMVGTIEPRKQQVRLLKALNDARRRHPELENLTIDLFGSLHPDCATALHAEIRRNPHIHYHQYAPEAEVAAAYERASFSAFVSAHEGYGLPIVESLQRGVPCLTASFGAMAEVANEGGCLTVDTLDDQAMVQGVLRMLNEPELIADLKRDIAKRPRFSWSDYVELMLVAFRDATAAQQRAEEAFRAAALEYCSAPSATALATDLHGVTWKITDNAADAAASTDRESGERASFLLFRELNGANIEDVAAADVLLTAHPEAEATIIEAAERESVRRILPPSAFFGMAASAEAVERAIAMTCQRARALALHDKTDMRCTMLRAFWSEIPHPPEKLAIVLSTFNRAGFIEHNVEWLLNQIDSRGLSVRCVVVDNASTDDSFHRLQRFVHHPRFSLVENPNNVGMLGNLHVCGGRLFAPYVWLTGDDDYIVPGRIEAVLEAIDSTPGLPLMVHNFAVYHRMQFSPTDHATQFLAEMQRLAPDPRGDGVRPINKIAEEHDNLFTAIYPLVFRADVLAACFDYPFTGIPFGDLTECVPTTKLLLGSYAYCAARWFAEVGIVGNAHNSWSAHRPRWHLVLMPLVLQLARDSGVDEEKVWTWLKVHDALFEDAVSISIDRSETANIHVPEDLNRAQWCFRKAFALDERLALAAPASIKQWVSGVKAPAIH